MLFAYSRRKRLGKKLKIVLRFLHDNILFRMIALPANINFKPTKFPSLNHVMTVSICYEVFQAKNYSTKLKIRR